MKSPSREDNLTKQLAYIAFHFRMQAKGITLSRIEAQLSHAVIKDWMEREPFFREKAKSILAELAQREGLKP